MQKKEDKFIKKGILFFILQIKASSARKKIIFDRRPRNLFKKVKIVKRLSTKFKLNAIINESTSLAITLEHLLLVFKDKDQINTKIQKIFW